MKKIIVMMIIPALLICVSPAMAKVAPKNASTKEKFWDKQEIGVKLDAPNLVRFNKDWTFGTEFGKNLNQTDVEEGWFGYGKITYSGSLINFGK